MNCFRLILLLLWVAGYAPATQAVELRVLAAASLSDALHEVGERYAETTGQAIVFSFGSSGRLARQIREGAPADVFVSADALRMDHLESDGLLREGTRRNVLQNSLVLIVAARQGADVETLHDLTRPTLRRLALGEPATVPVGTYAKAYLQQLGLWSELQSKIIPLNNVRSVLSAVEAGNADAGFVYHTDALISSKVRIAVAIPQAEGPQVIYPAAVLKDSREPESSEAFIAFLAGAQAQAVFAKYGFLECN